MHHIIRTLCGFLFLCEQGDVVAADKEKSSSTEFDVKKTHPLYMAEPPG